MTEYGTAEQMESEGVTECFPPEKPLPFLTISASELQHKKFPPVSYVVPPYVPEGLTILAGRPKLGKSWACLDWACAVASGDVAFDEIQCEAGDVLYLSLEDNEARLQRRLERLCPDGKWSERLSLATGFKRLDEGGLEDLEKWIDDADNPRLIIIDVFNKVRPARRVKDSEYESDYKAMKGLHSLASANPGLAIVVVSHVRKMGADDPLDTVSGTLGFTGAADTVLVLNRDANGVTLYGRGRDIEEIESAVQFDQQHCRWKVLGDADEVRLSDQRKRIVDAVRELDDGEGVGPKAIAEEAGLSGDVVRKLCPKMVANGQLNKPARGIYTLP